MTAGRATLAGWVAAYDAQGWHRSGSVTDARSARWLAARAVSLGAAPRSETFPFTRLVAATARLSAGGVTVTGVPLFDANLPGDASLTGTLGPVGSDADLAVTTAGPTPSAQDDLTAARRHGRHRGIVAVSRSPGLALRNSEAVEAFGVPVVQVPGRGAPVLERWAAATATVTVSTPARRVPATAINVVATVAGTRPDEAPVVVLTPRSGWWHCAAERGGGLACWLAALGDVLRRRSTRSVHFVATSGHELAYAGFHAHLAAGPIHPGATWVHLGANIGARAGQLGLAASDPDLEGLACTIFSRATPGPDRTAVPVPLRRLEAPAGEGGELQRVGARVVSIVASNERFHQCSDRYPDNVDIDTVHHVSAAVCALVTELAA